MANMKNVVKKIKAGFLKQACYEIAWTYRLLSDHVLAIVAYTLLSLISVGISLLLTTKMQALVDGVISQDLNVVLKTGLFYACVGAVNVIMVMVNQRVSGLVSAHVKTSLSQRTYDTILKVDWETVIRHHSGDLMTRMQEDITYISTSTVGWIPTLLSQGIQCIVAVGIILYYDASMLLMIAVIAPIILVGSRVFLGKMYASNQRQREIASEVMSDYKESFQHLQSIKSFNLIDLFSEKMRAQQKRREKIDLEVNKYSVASWGVMYVSGQIAAIICLAWAIYHVYTGVITLGSLTMLMMLALTVSGNFKTMIQLIPTAVNSLASSERIRAILELPEEVVENEEAYDKMLANCDGGVSLKISNMDFSYQNGKQVFQGVNMHVDAGEIVALVGPSGEGKTTMLRILLGIIQAQGDCILSTNTMSLPIATASRKLMAYVPQGNTMLRGTIAENLRMLKPDATDEEIVTALKESCAWEFVEKLPDGIYHNIGESGIGFSEGQNQRLAIARALMCSTPLLLLDEATSALDVATERRVLANLMKGNSKRTCILTTHRPSVLSMCDRVYRIANLQVQEVGEAEVQQIMNDF